jgi:excisionase family DNA binding protein
MGTLTTEQAAEHLGISPARVRVLIRAGRLPADHFGRAYVINEKDLQLVADRKPGRPPQNPKDLATGRGRHSSDVAKGKPRNRRMRRRV